MERALGKVLPLAMAGLQLTYGQAGSLQGVFVLVYAFSCPVFGWWGDRAHRLRLAALGVVIWSAASFASGQAPTFAALLVARALVGVGEAKGSSPWRRARIVRRSMWNGSLTSRTSRRGRPPIRRATPAIDSLVVRPAFSMRIAESGTPCRMAYRRLTAAFAGTAETHCCKARWQMPGTSRSRVRSSGARPQFRHRRPSAIHRNPP